MSQQTNGALRVKMHDKHAALVSLGKLMGTMYITYFLFVTIVLGMIARLSGIPSTAEVKESRVFDKDLMNQMIQGIGEQAAHRLREVMRRQRHAQSAPSLAKHTFLVRVVVGDDRDTQGQVLQDLGRRAAIEHGPSWNRS